MPSVAVLGQQTLYWRGVTQPQLFTLVLYLGCAALERLWIPKSFPELGRSQMVQMSVSKPPQLHKLWVHNTRSLSSLSICEAMTMKLTSWILIFKTFYVLFLMSLKTLGR